MTVGLPHEIFTIVLDKKASKLSNSKTFSAKYQMDVNMIFLFSFFFNSSHQDETFSFLSKFHIFNGFDFPKNVIFGQKLAVGQKMTFFYFFFFEIVTSRRNFFLFFQNFVSSTVLISKKRRFRLKYQPQAEIMTFSDFFQKSSHQDEFFLFLPKFNILKGSDI